MVTLQRFADLLTNFSLLLVYFLCYNPCYAFALNPALANTWRAEHPGFTFKIELGVC